MGAPKTMKTMKAKAGKSLTKGQLAEELATATELKKGECAKVLNALAEVVATQVKKTGKLILPGVARVITRTKPATKAGKREIFGKMMMVKARPAKTVVKAFAVSSLKKSV